MSTVKEALNIASPTDLPAQLHKVSLGTVLQGLIPVQDTDPRTVTANVLTLTGEPGEVTAVVATAGGVTGGFTIIPPAAATATKTVKVGYSAEGIATLTFHAADAVTAAKVVKKTLPANLGTILAAQSGGCY